MFTDLTNDQRGWILTSASALTCILGSLVICVDYIWAKLFPNRKFDFKNSKGVLVASLSMSSGVLLFTAWYKLLPEAESYFETSPDIELQNSKLYLFGSYFGGITICTIINATIHALTSQSVVHCAHDVEGHPNDDHGHDHDHNHGHHHHHHHHHHYRHPQDTRQRTQVDSDEADESSPLLSGASSSEAESLSVTPSPQQRPPPPQQTTSLLDITDQRIRGKKCIGRCMGYSSIEECVVMKKGDGTEVAEMTTEVVAVSAVPHSEPTLATPEVESDEQHQKHTNDHHHHVSTRYSHLFSIGLQTALAISVHKIPEGFLTFATTHGNPELGFSVFLALAIHNFCEGFTIAFPLYLALGSRWIAIGASIVLGGLSQPIGAVLAWSMFKYKYTEEFSLTFGVLLAVTAGFLSIIGLQMYGASVMYGGKQSTTLAFTFLGVAIIAFTNLIT